MQIRGFRARAAVSAAVAAATVAAATLAATGAFAASQPTLVVYSAQGYDSAMVKAFTKATGIPTKLDDNSTGPLLTQIEASKNNPNWGLLWVDGDTAFAGLDKQGLLLKNSVPSGLAFNSMGSSVIPKDKSYTPTGLTLMAVVAYDSKVVKPSQVPKKWNDVLNAKLWTNGVGMDDPSQSGPTYPFVAGMMTFLGGQAKGKAWFTKLRQNGVLINPTNGPTLEALTAGQIKLALVQSSAAIGAALTDKSLRVKYLNPATILPSAIGIDSKAPAAEQQEAEKFVSFVLSKQGQKVMQGGDPTGDSLYYPVVKGVTPLKALPPITSVRTQRLNPYQWGPRESAINSWFDENIK